MVPLLASLACGLSYAVEWDVGLAAGNDGSPDKQWDGRRDGCWVEADHAYHWGTGDPPRNNHPLERSLYPGDITHGEFTWDSGGCCKTATSGPAAVGGWSSISDPTPGAGRSATYIQRMAVITSEPSPGSVTDGGYLATATYDDAGRSRTHHVGAIPGTGMTPGASFTVRGYVMSDDPTPMCTVLAASVTLQADFRFRHPFWETSIFEHHVLTPEGWPASNLDYTNYPHDAIPLEAGSNLVFGGHRAGTISVTHDITYDTGRTVAEFHCVGAEPCQIALPAAAPASDYVGNAPYGGAALNPPWNDTGEAGMLDPGEAIFVLAAGRSGPVRITSTMHNDGVVVARGYNETYQFVPAYAPAASMEAVSNTASPGNHSVYRPISVVISYNGTISDTIHYCSAGISYDADGSPLGYGDIGAADIWGRKAGDVCPERGTYGETTPRITGAAATYVVHPPEPAAVEWGRWTAVNPETRMHLTDFAGRHVVCLPGEPCRSHHTPYHSWDYSPGTERDFVPSCTMDAIAALGDANEPKPADWYGSTPHSYRDIFATSPQQIPSYHVVDSARCEAELGPRACVPRGSECLPEHDRRCEDAFRPYLYPDDYIVEGHERLAGMVREWCGGSPTESCVLEAYHTIDDIMVSMCEGFGVDYAGYGQVIDAGIMNRDTMSTPLVCHNALAVGLYVPAIDGTPVDDWRACYGRVPDGAGVWPDGMPDAHPGDACSPVWGGGHLSIPLYGGKSRNVYVPYTPTTGAFGGVVERPGTMLYGDGALTCSCPDVDGDGMCDYGGPDLNGNGIADIWDSPTIDGSISCLDRTGTAAAGAAACWAKYGRDGLSGGTSGDLAECLEAAGDAADGPDGSCDPALVWGVIHEGVLDTTARGIDPVPYVVDGRHVYCDDSLEWCHSSGDAYPDTQHRRVCEDPDGLTSVKRIPARSVMPPLYQPAFEERWPPPCLPAYAVGGWERPAHDVSLDLAGVRGTWPTRTPGSADTTPSHIGMNGTTMMLHAGTGVVRFAACPTCDVSAAGDMAWEGTITSRLGGARHDTRIMMDHPPGVVSQEGTARVVAVEPCDACPGGWAGAAGVPGVEIVVTAYPAMDRPATSKHEMAAHECQIDGDGGVGILNLGAGRTMDRWHGMSCRDGTGMSLTIQDYESARLGPAAAREAGQPWTVAEGVNDVTVRVARNGIWLDTIGILEHRGQCTVMSWSPNVTAGHTSCPATLRDMRSCVAETGDIRKCADAVPDVCANVFVEDGIHKKWEFTEAERYGVVDRTGCLPGEACAPAYGGGGGGDPGVVYRFPNGSYSDGNHTIPPDVMGVLAASPSDVVLRCEEGVGVGGERFDTIHGIPAGKVDFAAGGSFACGAVQGCDESAIHYKCMGGELVEHVVCVVPAESFHVLDMPYSDVVGSVGPQMLHVDTICPADHPHAGPDSPGCDGAAIHDTHYISESDDHALIYVDYFGVGVLAAGRDGISSDTVHLSPPETFGKVHHVRVERDGMVERLGPNIPCTTCYVEYAAGGLFVVENVYGATLEAEVAGARVQTMVPEPDRVAGVLWLLLPAMLVGAGTYLAIRRYGRHFDLWNN